VGDIGKEKKRIILEPLPEEFPVEQPVEQPAEEPAVAEPVPA